MEFLLRTFSPSFIKATSLGKILASINQHKVSYFVIIELFFKESLADNFPCANGIRENKVMFSSIFYFQFSKSPLKMLKFLSFVTKRIYERKKRSFWFGMGSLMSQLETFFYQIIWVILDSLWKKHCSKTGFRKLKGEANCFNIKLCRHKKANN
jgi:hypothetical protein